MLSLTMNRVTLTIIGIGLIYSLVCYLLIGEGIQVFGLCGMFGALAINFLWGKSGMPFTKYLIKHTFSIIIYLVAIFMSGFVLGSRGLEALIVFIFMLPGSLLGLAWLIFVFELPGRVFSSNKKT